MYLYSSTAKPQSVKHCEIVKNATNRFLGAVAVSCKPSWDGGLKQSFTLEIRESKNKHSRTLAAIQHSPIPYFNLHSLKHREHYLFIITAVNSRGTSPPVTVSYLSPISQVAPSSPHILPNRNWWSWLSTIAIVLGVMITVLSVVCAAIGLIKFKAATALQPKPHKPSATLAYADTCDGEATKTASKHPELDSNYHSDDKRELYLRLLMCHVSDRS